MRRMAGFMGGAPAGAGADAGTGRSGRAAGAGGGGAADGEGDGTGAVRQNEHQALEPASVTKVMTLLLTMEAIEKGSPTTTMW